MKLQFGDAKSIAYRRQFDRQLKKMKPAERKAYLDKMRGILHPETKRLLDAFGGELID